MINKNEQTKKDVGLKLFIEAAEAFTYTDEEIMQELPPEEAKEFIELRNSILAERKEDSYNSKLPLAAEDEPQYNNK